MLYGQCSEMTKIFFDWPFLCEIERKKNLITMSQFFHNRLQYIEFILASWYPILHCYHQLSTATTSTALPTTRGRLSATTRLSAATRLSPAYVPATTCTGLPATTSIPPTTTASRRFPRNAMKMKYEVVIWILWTKIILYVYNYH